MSTPTTSNLIDELRRRIRDTHHSVPALTIGVNVPGFTGSAILEVTQGHLIFTGSGGGIRSFDLDLTNALNSTIGQIHDSVQRMPGMACVMENHEDPGHLAVDLEAFGPRDVSIQATQIRHRVFSDYELIKVLEGALRRHNPSLTIYSVPAAEFELTLTLAQAMITREMALDASKRKNTTETVNDLLSISNAFEETYARDNKRLARVIQSPREGNANGTRQGDVMQGSLYRRSLRTGMMTPMAAALPVAAPILAEPAGDDEEDDNVRVRWDRTGDTALSGYELWMDTQPNVIRRSQEARSGRGPLIENRTPQLRESSSTFLGEVRGDSYTYNPCGFSTYMVGGSLVTSVVVGGLEPDTDYYFRVFALSTNGEASASDVVAHRTRARRARFRETAPFTPQTAAAAALVTVTLDPAWAPFTAAHTLSIGGKVVTATIVTGYSITFLVPTFIVKGYKDLVITSPDGALQSVVREKFKVT